MLWDELYNPRYHSNYGKIRHFPDSVKPFAFTQQYGRSLLGKHTKRANRSVLRLRSDRSYGLFAIVLHQPTTLCAQTFQPSSSQSFFVIFKFEIIIAPSMQVVNTFRQFFHNFTAPCLPSRFLCNCLYTQRRTCIFFSVSPTAKLPEGLEKSKRMVYNYDV